MDIPSKSHDTQVTGDKFYRVDVKIWYKYCTWLQDIDCTKVEGFVKTALHC